MELEIHISHNPKLERIPPADAFPVRTHHWKEFSYVIEKLIGIPKGTKLDEFCLTIAIEDANRFKRYAENEDKKGRNPQNHSFRSKYGTRADDERLPLHYPEDIIGNNPHLYAENMYKVYSDFLSLPDSTTAVIGHVKDGMCRSCVFGNGNGGFHCQTFATRAEYNSLQELKKTFDSFLDRPEVEKAGRENPKRYSLKVEKFEYNPPLVWYEPGSEGDRFGKTIVNQDIIQIILPLGLLRDILTFHASKVSISSYQQLLLNKNLL